MALMFAINPLLYLRAEGRLPLPFMKKSILRSSRRRRVGTVTPRSAPPLLDAKGRAVPPDVSAIVARLEAIKEAQKFLQHVFLRPCDI